MPSVLDSAAAILATSSTNPLDDDRISVVAPATRSGVASPIGSYGSRSPSPTWGPGRRASLMVPSPPLQTNISLGSPARGTLSIQTSPISGMNQLANMSTPSIVTPTSAYYSIAETGNSSPTTTTTEHPPSSFPQNMSTRSPDYFPAAPLSPPSPIVSSLSASSAGPSNSDKRLSFMSYTDLLTSTPASLQPLSSLTTSASSTEPPPHIPSVSGMTQASASQYLHSPSHSPGRAGSFVKAAGVIEGRTESSGDRSSIAFDDVVGEWEREGFGGGLEERLEALLGPAAAGQSSDKGSMDGMLTPVRMGSVVQGRA